MILYAAAGATGLAVGHVAFPRFLRAFIKYQYGRILREDERERRRGLLTERAYLHGFEVEEGPIEPAPSRPPPPPARKPAVGTHARRVHDFGQPEVEAIYEFGSKDPVAWVRVADGAQVEQMVCDQCYMGYDYKIEARVHKAGDYSYAHIPPGTPKCKHCNGRGKFNVTRLRF